VLDLADGSHHELSREHVPVLGRWGVSTTGGSWEAGSVAGRLLRDERGSLFLVEPNTGGIRPVVPSPD
jgi:hypothetical protein